MEDSHLVDECRDGATPGTRSIQLEVNQQSAGRPTQMLGGGHSRIAERVMCPIQVHIVIRCNSAAVAMGGNLDVVPGVRLPALWIARDVRRPPMRTTLYVRKFPFPGIAGTLRTKNHSRSIRHDLVHV